MRVLELFCAVADVCQTFDPTWHKHCILSGTRPRHRARELALSEVMTSLLRLHQSHSRTFTAF